MLIMSAGEKHRHVYRFNDMIFELSTIKNNIRKKQFSLRTALDYLVKEATEGRLGRDVVMALIAFARKEKPDIKSVKIARKPREALPEDLTNDK